MSLIIIQNYTYSMGNMIWYYYYDMIRMIWSWDFWGVVLDATNSFWWSSCSVDVKRTLDCQQRQKVGSMASSRINFFLNLSWNKKQRSFHVFNKSSRVCPCLPNSAIPLESIKSINIHKSLPMKSQVSISWFRLWPFQTWCSHPPRWRPWSRCLFQVLLTIYYYLLATPSSNG